MKITKHDFEKYLNEMGTPEDEKKINGGRIPDSSNYGTWLRRNDCIAFEVAFREWER